MATQTDQLVRPGAGEAELERRARARWGAPPDINGPILIGKTRIAAKGAPIGPGYEDAPPEHPGIDLVRSLFATWPEARDGFGDFVSVFWPLEAVPRRPPTSRGSTSGHEIRDGARCAYVTVYDPYGCYEGLLHEWAHLRLLALGIGLEEHDGELLDHGDDVYISPIRRDKLRPMSAVLHGFLAWVFLSQGDLHLAAAGHADEVRSTVKWNVPKLEEGILTMRAHARWTPAGAPFGATLIDWARQVVHSAWELLGAQERPSALRAHREWVETTAVPQSPLHGTEGT